MTEQRPTTVGTFALWTWRIVNTALLAVGVWALWRQTGQLENLNGELLNLIDYLNVIADRMG